MRDFPLCVLTKSYEEIKKEVETTDPLPTKEKFIDDLKVSQQLKDWMKKHDVLDLTQLDLDKMITADDVMSVPEFLAAYQRSNSGGVTNGLPTPKFHEVDKTANPGEIRKDERRVREHPEEIHDRAHPAINKRDGVGSWRGETQNGIGTKYKWIIEGG